MKSKPAATEPANSDRRKHFEAGIFRQAIGQAYWDATKTHMKPDACVREAIRAGGRTLLSNRSMELKELSNKALEGAVWERIRPNVSALLEMKNFDMRCNQVVAVVTRTMTDAALQFLDGR
ncbi:MAG TPA: hypothetical protein VJT08_08055, partial [Terriglobales bacterium]|nr:hypothetical protein [Terriglobales bacterium]